MFGAGNIVRHRWQTVAVNDKPDNSAQTPPDPPAADFSLKPGQNVEAHRGQEQQQQQQR